MGFATIRETGACYRLNWSNLNMSHARPVKNLQSAIENLKSTWSIVPVVQPIEQGFPKAKTAFLLDFAVVLSSAQTIALKRLE
jgi:hypothetical protein